MPLPGTGRGALLVFHPGALGDVVLAIPSLMQLKQSYHRMDIAGQGWLKGFFRRIGLFDGWHASDSRQMSSLFAPSADPEAARFFASFDRILLLSFSGELEAAVQQITGRERVIRIPPRPLPAEEVHVADHIARALAACALSAHAPLTGAPALPDTWRGGAPPASDAPSRVLLHPGSGSPRKNWPLAHFFKLAGKLANIGFQPEWLFGPADRAVMDVFTAAGNCRAPVHTPADFDALFDLLAAAGGLIGNDSGVVHLAALLGLATVAVFGPSDPLRWAPRGPRAAAVRAAASCPPCFERQKGNCPLPRCLTATTPDAVLARFLMLGRDRFRPSGDPHGHV